MDEMVRIGVIMGYFDARIWKSQANKIVEVHILWKITLFLSFMRKILVGTLETSL